MRSPAYGVAKAPRLCVDLTESANNKDYHNNTVTLCILIRILINRIP